MQAFKIVLKMVVRNPLYLLLYIVLFGVLGVFIVAGMDSSTYNQFSENKPVVAIIDRDHSQLSESVTGFLAERTRPVQIEDSPRALQDATAQNLSPYIVVIPEGYGKDFLEAVRDNKPEPKLQTIVNYIQSAGPYMDLLTNEYLGILRMSIIAYPDAPLSQLIDDASQVAALQADIDVVDVGKGVSAQSKLAFYYQWSSYPLTAGIIALTALIFRAFQTGELRRRNLCAPVSPSAMSIQVTLGGTVLVLMSWAFITALSLLPQVGGLGLANADFPAFGMLALAALVYALAPFAIGFLLSQLGVNDMAANGASAIISLAFCFVSGAFMGDIDILSEEVQALAHFTPTYWYIQAIQSVVSGTAGASGADLLSGYLGSLGIVLLFAIAFFSVALVAGRLRAQTADAGGNTAADPE
jgi:ABC-2 type transport system permease protein